MTFTNKIFTIKYELFKLKSFKKVQIYLILKIFNLLNVKNNLLMIVPKVIKSIVCSPVIKLIESFVNYILYLNYLN